MSVKTIYVCDKCKKEWDKKSYKEWDKKSYEEQICSITLQVDFGCAAYAPENQFNRKTVNWCRTCVMSEGVEEPKNESDKKVAPEVALTTEDKLIMLLNELGFVNE
jgi:protein-arginine kinase activator protein McsA